MKYEWHEYVIYLNHLQLDHTCEYNDVYKNMC